MARYVFNALSLLALMSIPVKGVPAGSKTEEPRQAISAACASGTGTSNHCGLLVSQTATTVVTSTSGASSWKETYVGTSLSAYSTLTAPTTITTKDTAEETVVAVVLAGGLAWLAVPKPGAPFVEPPQDPPQITSPPEPSHEPTHTTTSSSSTSTTSPLGTQDPMGLVADSHWQKILAQPIVHYDDNHVICVPQDDRDVPTVSRNTISSKIDKFCKDKNGKVANKTVATSETFNVGAGKRLNITVSQYSLCDGLDDEESTIFDDDCKYFLHEALDNCDTKTQDKRGGKVNDACLIWSLQPSLHSGELTCGAPVKDGSGFNRDEARTNIEDFCEKNTGKKVSHSSSETQTYKPRLGNSNMELSASMSGDDECGSKSEPDYTIDEDACKRFLYRAVDDCDTNYSGYLGKFGGNVTDGCGVFKFSTSVEEILHCGDAGVYKNVATLANLTSAAAEGGIKKYCDDSFTLDPNYKPDRNFHQFGAPGTSNDSFPADGIAARMWTFFDGEMTTGFLNGKKFDTKGDECRRKMGAIQEKCGEQGGVLSSNNLDGCTIWSLYATEG